MQFANLPFRYPNLRICIENPVGIMNTRWRPPSQIIQPWQYGEQEQKKTCLWLRGLPKLKSTGIPRAPEYSCHCGLRYPQNRVGKCPQCTYPSSKARAIWENQTPSGQNKLTPSPERATTRSRTYYGVADAMAAQWYSPSQWPP